MWSGEGHPQQGSADGGISCDPLQQHHCWKHAVDLGCPEAWLAVINEDIGSLWGVCSAMLKGKMPLQLQARGLHA